MKVGDLVRIRDYIAKELPNTIRQHGWLWVVKEVAEPPSTVVILTSLTTGKQIKLQQFHVELPEHTYV